MTELSRVVGNTMLRSNSNSAAGNDLIDAAEAIPNPRALSCACLPPGIACCDADPVRARHVLRKGLVPTKSKRGYVWCNNARVIYCSRYRAFPAVDRYSRV